MIWRAWRHTKGLLREPFIRWGNSMDRVAVFVDAGYLFAQGSAALSGSKKPRKDLILDEKAVLEELIQTAQLKSGGLPLLRVYWYDGMGIRGPSAEQALLANSENFKVRLGVLNNQSQQKGVDSLIVTDLIDLARNGAMADVVLLSGDEDVRIGVQIAQAFGVRAHLIGIFPSRGSQSRLLLQEADSTTEWDKATVEKFLFLRPVSVSKSTSSSLKKASPAASPPPPPITSNPAIDKVVIDIIASLNNTDIAGIKAYSATRRGVPSEYDGKLLACCRDELERDLTLEERQYARVAYIKTVRTRP